jgi:hypothetical protein
LKAYNNDISSTSSQISRVICIFLFSCLMAFVKENYVLLKHLQFVGTNEFKAYNTMV